VSLLPASLSLAVPTSPAGILSSSNSSPQHAGQHAYLEPGVRVVNLTHHRNLVARMDGAEHALHRPKARARDNATDHVRARDPIVILLDLARHAIPKLSAMPVGIV
jgi:hypothetical protein